MPNVTFQEWSAARAAPAAGRWSTHALPSGAEVLVERGEPTWISLPARPGERGVLLAADAEWLALAAARMPSLRTIYREFAEWLAGRSARGEETRP